MHCYKLDQRVTERCSDCVHAGGTCGGWLAAAPDPGPDEAPRVTLLAGIRPASEPDPLLRYLNYLQQILTLPADKQGALAVLLHLVQTEAEKVTEQSARLYAEVERLRPIAEAMKLVDQISDQRQQIAHLQAELARVTGITDAGGGGGNG